MDRVRRRLAVEAALVAAAIALQSVHGVTSYDAGFMYVDVVGVPAVIATLLLGMRGGVRVAAATALGIYLLDGSGLVGALLKLAATMSTIVALRCATARWTFVLAALSAFLVAGGASLTFRVLGAAALYVGLAAVALPLVAGVALAVGAPDRRAAQASIPRSSARLLLVPLLAAIMLRGTLMIAGDLFFAVPVFFHESVVDAMRAYPPATIFLWNGVQAVIDAVAGWVLAGALQSRV